MYKRLLKLPLNGPNSIFLFGPRGVGKTSWIKETLKSAIYLDLLNFNVFSLLFSNPARLEKAIPPGFTDWVIIDEVQRVPELLNEVHRLIEEKKLRFLLTGSSARSLRKKGTNLLAGRAFKYHMHPLLLQEVEKDFDLTKALKMGLLPSVFTNPEPQKYLENYVQTYLREEVQQEGLTRNLASFSKFLEAASFSQGQVLNYSEIARDLMINRFVVTSYFDILEDLLLAVRINAFTTRAKRKLITHQKFYFFDNGVFQTLKPKGPLDTSPESDGPGLETLFLQTLRALNDYLELGYQIYFWRTTTGQEVDFVLYGPKGLLAFEIKRSSQISSKDLRGLKSFKEDYPEAKLYFLYLGSLKEYHENFTAIPFEEALKELPTLLST